MPTAAAGRLVAVVAAHATGRADAGRGAAAAAVAAAAIRALQMAADGAQALSGFLAGRDLEAKSATTTTRKSSLKRCAKSWARTTNPSGQQLARLIELQQEVNETQAAVLGPMITALDIQAGAGVAKVVNGFMDGSGPSMGAEPEPPWPSAPPESGAGLLLSRDSRDRRRRR